MAGNIGRAVWHSLGGVQPLEPTTMSPPPPNNTQVWFFGCCWKPPWGSDFLGIFCFFDISGMKNTNHWKRLTFCMIFAPKKPPNQYFHHFFSASFSALWATSASRHLSVSTSIFLMAVFRPWRRSTTRRCCGSLTSPVTTILSLRPPPCLKPFPQIQGCLRVHVCISGRFRSLDPWMPSGL